MSALHLFLVGAVFAFPAHAVNNGGGSDLESQVSMDAAGLDALNNRLKEDQSMMSEVQAQLQESAQLQGQKPESKAQKTVDALNAALAGPDSEDSEHPHADSKSHHAESESDAERTSHHDNVSEKEAPPTQHLRASAKSTASAAPGSKQHSDSQEKKMDFDLGALTNSSNLDTSAMEKQLTDLMLSGGSVAGTPFGKSVNTIKEIIEKEMMGKVLQAHKANQAQLIKEKNDIEDCGSTKEVSVSKADKKKAVYLKTSPLHKTCRAGEAGKHTEKIECHSEERDKKRIMDLKCKEFAMVSKRYGDQQANGQIVKKGGSEENESYIRRLTSTICGRYPPGGKGGGGKNGFLDLYIIAKEGCEHATKRYNAQVKKCKIVSKEYSDKKAECDSLQDQMDNAACKRAVEMKDACETYAECYFDKHKVFTSTEAMVKTEEKDRKAEWRGLKRMQCLMKAFMDGKVSNSEIKECKSKTHGTDHLNITYPVIKPLGECVVPDLYPSTAEYKLAEFAMLPSLAKGKEDANTCAGVVPIPTKPMKGSPPKCKCERATLNGPYSAGPLVKCTHCLDMRRSQDRSSCPEGTKLFSPRSAEDWKTIFGSVGELKDPHFIVDITRKRNGCGAGCGKHAMNSKNKYQSTWKTSDGSPWWLRSKPFKEPNGNYHANCYMKLMKPYDENNIHFDDHDCNIHSKSYYCQLKERAITPKRGSPAACKCDNVVLAGEYSAGALLKCTGCLPVSRSTQKNSCPVGTKIFSPASGKDWKTFLASAQPLRSPHFIIDVTRPQNGCGGCNHHAMNSENPSQKTWRTSDGSAWWLRSQKYSEPTHDYSANCYMDLFGAPPNENTVQFKTKKCKFFSNAYYCQPVKKKEESSR